MKETVKRGVVTIENSFLELDGVFETPLEDGGKVSPFLTFDAMVELSELCALHFKKQYPHSAELGILPEGPFINEWGVLFWNHGEELEELCAVYFEDFFGDEPFFSVGDFGWIFLVCE